MNDTKGLSPAANGFPPGAAAGLWHPYLQQRDIESQRERLFSQMNPAALAMAIAERERNEITERTTLHLLEFERAKAANALCGPNMAGLNGYHNANAYSSLSSMASVIGASQPLIPTSQSKVNPSTHHSSPSQTTDSSSNREAYQR